MQKQEAVFAALDAFKIELPSWGFANTGTRFGKFVQDAAATNIEEKFQDAAFVHHLTGAAPTIALHVLWDLPAGIADVPRVQELERKHNIKAGSINPNLFQDQEYKFGSIANPDAGVRRKAIQHLLDSVAIGTKLGSRDIAIWDSDGSNYPGSQNIRKRIQWTQEALSETHAALNPNQRMLVEYKPFEPAFYHTDIADWGMALTLAQSAGPQAKVLVDTGHHYQGQNIEQIVAWLLELKMLGGFHFNDRKYADDDLTLGSMDPYQAFRILFELCSDNTDAASQVAFMIDQSHNLKGKMEAAVQTVMTAQEIYAKAALVDRDKLYELQDACRLVEAEELYRGAFWTDVRPIVQEWRVSRKLAPDPLRALAESGYIEEATNARKEKNRGSIATYA